MERDIGMVGENVDVFSACVVGSKVNPRCSISAHLAPTNTTEKNR